MAYYVTTNMWFAANRPIATVEIDLGSTPIFRGKFTITDANITTSSRLLVWQAPGPYTGKGTLADEAEMQPVQVVSVEPLTGSAVVRWQTPPEFALVTEWGDGRRNIASTFANFYQPAVRQQRLGKVRGNVKFTYIVFNG